MVCEMWSNTYNLQCYLISSITIQNEQLQTRQITIHLKIVMKIALFSKQGHFKCIPLIKSRYDVSFFFFLGALGYS